MQIEIKYNITKMAFVLIATDENGYCKAVNGDTPEGAVDNAVKLGVVEENCPIVQDALSAYGQNNMNVRG